MSSRSNVAYLKNFHSNSRERRKKITEIRYNLHESIYELVRNVSILGLNFDTAENRIRADYIMGIGKYPPQVFDDVSSSCNHLKTDL